MDESQYQISILGDDAGPQVIVRPATGGAIRLRTADQAHALAEAMQAAGRMFEEVSAEPSGDAPGPALGR